MIFGPIFNMESHKKRRDFPQFGNSMTVTRRTALVTAVMKNNRKLFDLLFEQVSVCKYQILIKSL